jgi:predicted nucleic acid-binding protein
MQVFDASSMLFAWDNYPINQFPPLWKWIAIEIQEKNLKMATVALKEVSYKSPDCGKWLKDNSLEQLEIGNEIFQDAMRIKGILGIADDKYSPKGVDENDLLIIATARFHGAKLISNEAKQMSPPDIPANRKIPSVCNMKEVSVACIDFVEYIKKSKAIFSE